MPSNSATARLIIEVRDGQATRNLRRVDRGFRRATRSATIFQRATGSVNRFVATASKALISMVVILIAFNLAITAPQTAFRGLIALIRATVSTLAEFEQRILGLQGILASTVRFLQDPVENFRNAGLVATGVIEQLALRANEMVTSLTEASIVFQTLIASGAQRSIRDVGQLVDLTILLSNSIAGITTGQARQRQLAEETRSLFTQQLRANSLLTRILFRNRREMREFFREAEATDTVVERLAERLSGFALVARDLGRTIEGIQTTAITLLQVLARRAFGGLITAVQRQVADIFEEVQSNTGRLNLLAASLAAAVLTIVDALRGIVRDTFGIVIDESTNFLRLLFELVPAVTQAFLTIIFVITDVSQAIRIVVNLLQIAIAAVRNFFTIGARLVDFFSSFTEVIRLTVFVISILLGLLGVVSAPLTIGIAALAAALGNAGETLSALRSSLEGGLRGEAFQRDLTQLENALSALSISDPSARAAEAMGPFRRFFDEQAARIEAEQAALRAAEQNILTLRRVNLDINIRVTDELLKQSRATRSQVSNVLQILRLSRTGAIGRSVSNLIGGSISDLEQILRAQISTLGQQLQRNIFDLSRAQGPDVIADPQEIEKLSQRITQLRGEMAALGADLVALVNTFAQFGRTTFENISQTIGDLLLGGTFQSLFDQLRTEGNQLRSLFQGITTDILNFIKSAEGQIAIISAIGNALSGAITSALSGAQGFGASLKQLLGDLLIAIGQALIVAGAASVLFGLLTLNARLIGEGVVAIAVGTVAIAAGLALGGGGGRQGAGGGASGGGVGAGVQESAFSQQQIATQQHFARATDSLRESSENINAAAGSIQGVPPGQVFTQGAKEMGGLTRVLASDARRGDNFSAARDAARVFQG